MTIALTVILGLCGIGLILAGIYMLEGGAVSGGQQDRAFPAGHKPAEGRKHGGR